MSTSAQGMFAHPRQDLIAGTVVFLVAVPLCLGIAVACGMPPISGLIAGIAGGLVTPWISRSAQSVTGPAAGLTSIVLVEVQHLGGIAPLLAAVMAAGVIQLVLGVLRTGRFAALVPSAVIKGMLAAIGISIILKQIPVAVGSSGDLSTLLSDANRGAVLIALASQLILLSWPKTPLARVSGLSAALAVVLIASGLAAVFSGIDALALQPRHFVRIPVGSPSALFAGLPRPAPEALTHTATWIAAVTIAIVASIETLLSLQAIDRLDPLKRRSAPDRELIAQGAANLASGFFGGLPVTAVIVRGGANVAAGGRERLSALTHGVLLLIALLFAGPLLNRIPLAALAAVLIDVGLKLCAPSLFRTQYKLGRHQFLPYVLTIVAVLATDLLKGVIAGIVTALFSLLRHHTRDVVTHHTAPDGTRQVRFTRDGTFITKPALVAVLDTITPGESVVIDGTGAFVDHDTKEVLADFVAGAPDRSITVQVRGIDLSDATPGGGH